MALIWDYILKGMEVMKKKELRDYVYEHHRQGMTDKQIAERLKLSVDELAKMLNDEEEPKVAPPVVEEVEEIKEAPKKRGRSKKVSGVPSTEEDVKEEPKTETKEDLSWMED